MKRSLAAATASSLLLLCTSAFADNLSGYYVGASVTLGETLSGTAEGNSQADNPGESSTTGASDQFGSTDLKFGFNQVLENNMFVGIEGSYSLTGIDENVTDQPSQDDVLNISIESSYGIRGKLGAAVADKAALYGILGYEMSELKLSGPDEGGFAEDNDHTGIVYGIGATYAVTSNVLMTAEATQTNLGSETYFGEFDIEGDVTQINIGLAYRFNL